ncbi:MAG TPA: hypothetical protein VF599_08145 [Pyrinomonadaceae bacterium]|jgi:hypothetical protein
MNEEKNAKIVECNFKFRCPQKWEEMGETGQENVRFCGECKEKVYFAETDSRLSELRDAGRCVAVWEQKPGNDFLTRTAGVIMPPDFPDLKLPNGSRECQRCGTLHSTGTKFCGYCGNWWIRLRHFIKKHL